MRKVELKAYNNNLSEKFHALCLHVRSFADNTVFDEIKESHLVYDAVQTKPLRVRVWAEKYEQLPQPTEGEYVSRGLIVTKTGTAVPMSHLKLISNAFLHTSRSLS